MGSADFLRLQHLIQRHAVSDVIHLIRIGVESKHALKLFTGISIQLLHFQIHLLLQ